MSGTSLVCLGGFLFLVWIAVLVSHLRRKDCSDTDRIVWTIVLCTLNIVGVALYFFIGPAGDARVLTEQELKDKFNRGG
jgi:hypothetical protein